MTQLDNIPDDVLLLHIFPLLVSPETGGKQDIKNCALVCKRWRALALSILFEDLSLSNDKGRYILKDVLEGSSDITSRVRNLDIDFAQAENGEVFVASNFENQSRLVSRLQYEQMAKSFWISLQCSSSNIFRRTYNV